MENKEELGSDTESEVPEAHLGSNMLVTMRSKAQENEVRAGAQEDRLSPKESKQSKG